MTGITLIPGMNSVGEGFQVAASCAVVLAGALPMVHVFTSLCRKPLLKAGKAVGMNEVAVAGMIATLASGIPVFSMIKDMDRRGKVVNMAFMVSASYTFGDHLGFTAGFAPEMVFPVIAGKLVGGLSAVGIALWITKSFKKQLLVELEKNTTVA